MFLLFLCAANFEAWIVLLIYSQSSSIFSIALSIVPIENVYNFLEFFTPVLAPKVQNSQILKQFYLLRQFVDDVEKSGPFLSLFTLIHFKQLHFWTEPRVPSVSLFLRGCLQSFKHFLMENYPLEAQSANIPHHQPEFALFDISTRHSDLILERHSKFQHLHQRSHFILKIDLEICVKQRKNRKRRRNSALITPTHSSACAQRSRQFSLVWCFG